MILYENEFLKTYNIMNRLWEGLEDTGIFFDDVLARAIQDHDTLEKSYDKQSKQHLYRFSTRESAQFWNELRRLVRTKPDIYGNPSTMFWVDRFMRFYCTYRAETAILKKLQSPEFSFGSAIDFEDKANYNKLLPGGADNKADFKLILDGKEFHIDCKAKMSGSYVGATNTHNATWLIWHTPILSFHATDGQELNCEILSSDKTISRRPLGMPPSFKVEVEPSAQMKLSFKTILLHINQALTAADEEFQNEDGVYLLDQHTSAIAKTIGKNFSKKAEPNISLPSKDLVTARHNLEQATDALVSATRGIY